MLTSRRTVFSMEGDPRRTGATLQGIGPLALGALLAWAQPAAATAPVALSNVQTVLPAITDDAQVSVTPFANGRGGHTGLLTLELEDDFDAVQIGVENQFPATWGIDRVVVAPSASYGGDLATGSAAYDLDGVPLKVMLPVQWQPAAGPGTPPGNQVLSLVAFQSVAAGQTVLQFATTTTHPEFGSAQPGLGWFVADGLGCIAPGATVAAITTATVTLSAAVAGPGCGTGQSIYFSPVPFGSFGMAVPAATAQGSLALSFSDWIPMHSLPRSDGGFVVGARLAGPGIPVGTTLAAIGYAGLTLSQPLAAALPIGSPIHVHLDLGLAAAAASGATTMQLADATGVHEGQTVTTPGGAIAPRTHVASVAGSVVTLDKAIQADLSAGMQVSFTGTTWTVRPAKLGAPQVVVASTTRRPLLHIRYFIQPHGLMSAHKPGCSRDPVTDSPACEAPLGLPSTWIGIGGENAGQLAIDGVNFVGSVGAGAGTPIGQRDYPSIFVRILGRHAGATLLVCGGYQSSGATGSVSGEASVGRIGAAWASLHNPAVPISVLNVASHQNSTGTNAANCTQMVDTFHPSMALIQEYSNHNGTDPKSYRVGVRTLATHALLGGTQPIIYLAYVEAGDYLGAVTVASDVVNSNEIPMLNGISPSVSGSPTLVVGPGVPAGTVVTTVPGSWHLALSHRATVAAGSVLHFGYRVTVNNGQDVTLSDPSFFSHPHADVRAPGVIPGTTINVTQGSTMARLSRPATLAPGEEISLSVKPASSIAAYRAAAAWYYTATEAWAQVYLDGLAAVATDPLHPDLLCNGCTTDGAYANDYGNSVIAAKLVQLLQPLTGQTP